MVVCIDLVVRFVLEKVKSILELILGYSVSIT